MKMGKKSLENLHFRTHFFMAASSCFTLSGLCLGSSLIMLVSAMSDEFNSTSVSQVSLKQ